MSDWKNVQYKNGKMRTNEGGGGGASNFADLDDVSFNNIQNGQIPKYNSTTQKWENADESGGGGTVTDVTVDGTSVVNPQTGVAEIEMPTPPTIPVEDVEVNGASVLNAQKVAEIKSYKEVTLAEYQVLPSSKNSDGILYCIKDSAGADSFPPLIYSDEEREVGVWRDGKPLYQKSFYLSSSGTSEVTIDVSSLSIDTFLFVPNASYKRASSNGNTVYLGFYVSSEDRYQCFFRRSANQIAVMGMGSSYLGSVVVTIQYTKTTDTAGSGTWTIQGGYAHHYSTDEKVIGTWVDGKPLYEKTCIFTLTQNNGKTVKNYSHNIANIETIVAVICKENRPRPYYGGDYEISIAMNNSNFEVETGRDRTTYEVIVIAQYTKTTD